MLTEGSNSSGANSSCQRSKALSGQMRRANGNPVAAAYFNTQRVYNSERVRPADLGARRFKMSSQRSSGGRTSEAYLVIACCCTSRKQLGWAHSHSKSALSVWRGDGPFRQKRPYKIPVLKAHRTRQMDKMGGYFLILGLFLRHGNLTKMSMDDQNSKRITLVEGIYGPM